MKKISVLLIIFSLIMSGCKNIIRPTDDGITVKKLIPAELNVSKYKKIAILDFDGKGGKQVADWLETSLQNAHVDGKPFFEVSNRSQMLKLIAEQRLALMGAIDPSSAAKIGKISGAQAVVTGTVSSFRVAEGRYHKRLKRYDGKREYHETVPCNVRDAYVEMTVSFIDATTGQNIASTSAEGQFIGDSCHGLSDEMGGGLAGALIGTFVQALAESIKQMGVDQKTDNVKIVTIDAPERMLKGAAMLTIDKFVKKITPHYKDVKIVLKENDSEGGFGSLFKSTPESEKVLEKYYDVAYKFAVRGQWEDAIEAWEKVLAADNKRPAATYNMGVAFEMLGDLALAEKQFYAATKIAPDEVFFDALARVRKEMADRDKLCKQQGNCIKPPPPPTGKSDSSVDTGRGSGESAVIDKKELIEGHGDKTPTKNPVVNVTIGNTIMIADMPKSKKYVGKANANSEVEKLAEQGDWVKIRVSLGETSVEGWIPRCNVKGEKCPGVKRKAEKPKNKSGKISPI